MTAANPAISGVFFDTHANVKKLKDVGFTEQQAEVQTEILSQLVEKDLVTKGYFDFKMKELDIRLKEIDGRFKELEAKLEAKLEAEVSKCKADIIKWVAALMMAQGGMIVALIKLL